MLANFDRKEHLQHRTVSLRQHGFLVQCKKSKSSNQIQYKHTVNYTQIMWMSNVNSKRICLNWAISVVSGFTGVYCMWMIDMTGWHAAVSRNPSVYVPLLCLLHYIRLVFHAKSLHWRHHWKLQHAEKEGIFFTIYLRLFHVGVDYCNSLLIGVIDGLHCRLQSLQNVTGGLVSGTVWCQYSGTGCRFASIWRQLVYDRHRARHRSIIRLSAGC